MKKILITLWVFLSVTGSAFALEEIYNFNEAVQGQKYLSNIGFKILNSNRIDKRIVFYYNYENKNINACARYYDKAIFLDKGITPFLESDDEYAAILSHEISHLIDSYEAPCNGAFYPLLVTLAPKKYEIKADKRAVDYMVKAGYNPLAIIVVFNKTFGQLSSDSGLSHPLTSKRMAYLYEYIYKKYPIYLANNEYKNNIYYQNFLLNSRENRLKLQEAVEHPVSNKSGRKIKIKYE